MNATKHTTPSDVLGHCKTHILNEIALRFGQEINVFDTYTELELDNKLLALSCHFSHQVKSLINRTDKHDSVINKLYYGVRYDISLQIRTFANKISTDLYEECALKFLDDYLEAEATANYVHKLTPDEARNRFRKHVLGYICVGAPTVIAEIICSDFSSMWIDTYPCYEREDTNWQVSDFPNLSNIGHLHDWYSRCRDWMFERTIFTL